jgi:hypothetical protein
MRVPIQTLTSYYRAQIVDASALIMNIVSRDLDRRSRVRQAAECPFQLITLTSVGYGDSVPLQKWAH